MDLSFAVFDIFDFENTATLKSGSGVTQNHRNWYHSTDWLWFPIKYSIETDTPFLRYPPLKNIVTLKLGLGVTGGH